MDSEDDDIDDVDVEETGLIDPEETSDVKW